MSYWVTFSSSPLWAEWAGKKDIWMYARAKGCKIILDDQPDVICAMTFALRIWWTDQLPRGPVGGLSCGRRETWDRSISVLDILIPKL